MSPQTNSKSDGRDYGDTTTTTPVAPDTLVAETSGSKASNIDTYAQIGATQHANPTCINSTEAGSPPNQNNTPTVPFVDPSRPFQCTEFDENGNKCFRTFRRQGDLTKHVKKIHGDSEYNIICPEFYKNGSKCTSTFRRPPDLERHRTKYHKDSNTAQGVIAANPEYPFTCHYYYQRGSKCLHAFKTLRDLITHRTHYHKSSNTAQGQQTQATSQPEGIVAFDPEYTFTCPGS